ncbi:MAG TPA: GAF domain-containing protein [Chloroflexota bacterium]
MQVDRSLVLVVEDEPDVRKTVCALLAEVGYAVEGVGDGEAALERIAAGGVDLVLLDLVLPGMDGVELCRQVRARAADEVYLPIIVLTGLADEAERRAGFAAGADDYVTKPFDAPDLFDRIDVWLRTRARLKAAYTRLHEEREANARLAAERADALAAMSAAHERLLAGQAEGQRLTREAEARTRTFRVLHEMAMAVGGVLEPAALGQLAADRARDLLGVDSVSLWWWDAEASVLRRLVGHVPDPEQAPSALPPGVGAPGVAFARCAPVVVEDYPRWPDAAPAGIRRGLRAAAAVPVLIGERAIGALGVYTFAPRRFDPDHVQLLALLAAQVGPALEAARLYGESERQRTEAEALAELARQAAVEPDPARVIDAITEQACRLLGADYAAVALREKDGTQRWAGVTGGRSNTWHEEPLWPSGLGSGGRAMAAGRTVVIERLGDNSAFPLEEFPRHRSEGGRTALSTPLHGQRGIFGALVLGWRSDVTVPPAQVRLAEALAGYAATILDSARARAEVAAEAQKLRRLAEVAAAITAETDLQTVLDLLVRTAAEAVGLEHNSLLLLDAERGTLAHAAAVGLPAAYTAAIDGIAIGPTVGTCGAAAYHGTTVLTEDVLTDPNWAPWRALVAPYGFRAVWSVPLVGKGGRVLGTFAAYRPRPGCPSAHQLDLLTLYARLAAVAVENARSYARAEHHAREAAARAAELAAVFESLPCGVTLVDAAGRLVLKNEASRQLWGEFPYPAGSVPEQADYYRPRDAATGRLLAPAETPIGRALAGETVQASEYLFRRRGDAEDTWLQSSAVPLRDAEGGVSGAVGVASDVTRERQLIRAVAASEERLRTLYHAMACGVLVRDAAGAIVDANEAAEEIVGYSLAEMRGKTSEELWPVARADESALPNAERPSVVARRTGDPLRQVLMRIKRPDGAYRWVQNNSVPVRGPDGRVVQVVSSFLDVTEQKRAEEERERLAAQIEQERAMLAAVMHSMSDGLIVLDAAGRIRYHNERALALVGVGPEPLVGQTAAEAFSRHRQIFVDPAAAWASLQQGLAHLADLPTHEVSVLGPPRRDLQVQLFPVANVGGAGPGWGAMLHDVSDTRLLALLQERERIAMDLHDGVIQSLYAVALGLGARARALDGNVESTREALRNAVTHINAVIQEVRNYIFDLRLGEQAARGVGAGLEALAAELRINALVQPELSVDPTADAVLAPEAAANLLQVAREATANVIRHAGATAVQIGLARESAALVLTVRDNGRGFDPHCEVRDTFIGAGGQGLHNMAERARLLGGQLTVDSEPGQGTTVRLEVPLDARGNGWTTAR